MLSFGIIKFENYYKTDNAIFHHYAIHLFLEKKNPYNYNMINVKAYKKYNIKLYKNQLPLTRFKNNTYETKFTYPAGSFIIPSIFYILHINDIRIVTLFFLILMVIISIKYVKKEYKLLPIVLLLVNKFFFDLTIESLPDIIVFFFILISFIFVNKKNYISIISTGLAISIKQTAWFYLPFYLIYFFKETKTVRLLLYIPLIFLLLNGYYIINDMNKYFLSVFAPFYSDNFPGGISIPSIFQNITNKKLFSLLQIFSFMIFVLLYCFKYKKLKKYLFIFIIISLFLGWRTLYNYFYGFLYILLFFL